MMMNIIMKSVVCNLIINFVGLLVIILYSLEVVRSYEIPQATIEILSPRGFRASIQDDEGVDSMNFHVVKNSHYFSYIEHTVGNPMTKDSDTNQWIYENLQMKLDINDFLYYWTSVKRFGQSYYIDESKYIVESSNCEKSITTVDNKLACKGALIFEDEFNSDLLEKWDPEIRIPLDSENAEFVSYQHQSDICYTNDSKLFIKPKPLKNNPIYSQLVPKLILDLGSSCTGNINRDAECNRTVDFFRVLPPVVSCKFNTLNTFKFKYGTIDIRAKLPIGDWMFPELYLEPVNRYYGDRIETGVIRIAFIRANRILTTEDDSDISGNILSGGVVLESGESNRNLYMKSSSKTESHWGNDFHTYRVIWTDKRISLYVDDELYNIITDGFQFDERINKDSRNSWRMDGLLAPFNKEFYISVGVGVGSMADFPDNCLTFNQEKKPWQNDDPKAELKFWNDIQNWNTTWDRNNFGLEIDYVKVWAI